jgi:hypothetical protein
LTEQTVPYAGTKEVLIQRHTGPQPRTTNHLAIRSHDAKRLTNDLC